MTKTLQALLIGISLSMLCGSAMAQEYDLEAMIEAAKGEPPINVYDSTGKIVEMAENFATKYGLKASGVKAKASEQLEMVVREAMAENVQADVVIISDAPAAIGQLVPQKFATSWLAPDIAEKVEQGYRDPLAVVTTPVVWAYNTELFESCPVSNLWELTEPEWRGRVAFQDPLTKTVYIDWFNQMEAHGDAALAAAYEARSGKPLELEEGSATRAFIRALAGNAPLMTNSDDAAAEAAGAPGQTEAFMALVSAAKFRENAASGFKLGICEGLKPWLGFTHAGIGLIASGTDSPNASRLFLRYVMTAEGIAPQAQDGKMSTNIDVGLPSSEPSGVAKVWDHLLAYNMSTVIDDWETRQDWQDFWQLNYSR
ncbi:ABC transporter substrate-binding protein [Devosia naphthalenivorans]|uniref:ABC transporter substrate-binding protein n=1 Tax=Devosia naphthalenivorans TaxID=2082392 RepID=UPI000D36B707|nr:ABC transporter substrate-binding protein [Devosia naphthalenivorans]